MNVIKAMEAALEELDKPAEYRPYEVDAELYDEFKAKGMLMPGMVRGKTKAKRKKADKSGLKARMRDLQREAAQGKASAKVGA